MNPDKEIRLRAEYLDPPELSPEQTLICAMIERAILDLQESVIVQPYDRRMALVWFSSSNTDPWSFLWACDEIGASPRRIRKHVEKIGYEKRRKFPYRVGK